MPKIEGILNSIILYSFLLLAIVTPLLFTTINTELYEVPKMFFVYVSTIILVFATKSKFLISGKAFIPKSPILITFLLFLIIQVLSTFLSIDIYTSIFGYPSRLNGGLISQIAYFSILFCALNYLTREDAVRILKASVVTAIAVALWGIPSHFGYDPTCVILINKLTSSCWHIDFDPTRRIFSTLGQPNWLASYMVLVLPFSAYLAIVSKQKEKLFYIVGIALILTATLFTYSRAGFLGAIGAVLIFCIFHLIIKFKIRLKTLILPAAILFISAVSFFLIQRSQLTGIFTAPPPDPGSPTESGKIRLVVWQGAIEIFKRWPIIGSGPETFVSSYFMYRPQIHNQNSEWEFFYNKAHNEFLNYLANTGILGLSLYLIFIFSIFFIFLVNFTKYKYPQNYIASAAVSAVSGYLISIFFGFSTVATSTTFFILISACTILLHGFEFYKLEFKFLNVKLVLPVIFLLASVAIFMETFIFRMFLSDVFEKRVDSLQEISLAKGLTANSNAVSINPVSNPYQLANFSYNLGSFSTAIEDAETIKETAEDADKLAQKAITISENNYLVYQRVSKTYVLIAENSDEYKNNARKVAEKLTKLAPTFPPAYLSAAQIYITLDNLDLAKQQTQKALELKPDYLEAQELMAQLTFEQ